MHNIDSILKLSYSPLTLFEFENSKEDKDINEYLTTSTIYVIAKRALPIMKLMHADSSGLHISVSMENEPQVVEIIMRTKDNVKFFKNGLSAIRTGSNILSVSDAFHSISLFRDNGGEDEFVLSANFDRLIHLASNNVIKINIKGDITPFVSYEVLYVGHCVEEHIFHRFKAHHALQDILIRENIIPQNYDKVNDLLILPFYVESDVVSVITGEAKENEFIEAMTGNYSFGLKEISLDCEKALIRAMTPRYNKTRFKQYPKSSDGLFNHGLDSYLYRIIENLVLCYDSDNKIFGDVNEKDASLISVIDDKEFSIFN
jgi:hypothetical protein